MSSGVNDAPTRRLSLLLLGSALLVGYLLTQQTMPDVFSSGTVAAYGEDDFYHLRRINYALRNGELLAFDRLMSYPDGAYSWWPDGFDGLLLTAVRLIAGEQATRAEVTVVCALMNSLLALLSIPVVYVLAGQLFGPRSAGLAALLAAFAPARVMPGAAGVVDHHCIEVLLSLVPSLLIACALTASRRRNAAIIGGLAGLWVGGCLYFWGGSLLIVVVVCGALALATLARPLPRWHVLAASIAAFAVCCSIAATWAVSQAPLGQQGVYRTYIVSRFHLAFVGLAMVELLLWTAAGWWTARRQYSRPWLWHLGLFAAGSALLSVGLSLLLRPVLVAVWEATGFVRSAGIVQWITEVQPAWRDWSAAVGTLSWLGPLLLCFAIGQLVQHRRDPRQVMLYATGLSFAGLGMLQFRHLVHFYPFGAALTVGLWFKVSAVLRRRLPDKSRERWGRSLNLAVLLLAVLLCLPQLRRSLYASLELPGRAEWLQIADWLRLHTPSPEQAYRPRAQPSYAVLAPWDRGKTVTGLGERATLGSPDALGDQLSGVQTLLRFYASSDPQRALNILDEYRVRYVCLGARPASHWKITAGLLNQPAGYYLSPNDRLRKAAVLSMHNRLYRFDGSAIGSPRDMLPAIRWMRLVYESPGPRGKRGQTVKVFRRTLGVRLTADLPSGAMALIEATIAAGSGRRFFYRDFSQVSARGALDVRFPYCEAPGRHSNVRMIGPVRVKVAGARLAARVKSCQGDQRLRLEVQSDAK